MKTRSILVLAALVLALTLSALPVRAAASTTSAAPPSDSQLVRASGDKPVKYMAVELAAAILESVRLP
jgi:hypothetical protein